MSLLYLSNKSKQEYYFRNISNTIEKYYTKLENTRNQYHDLKVKIPNLRTETTIPEYQLVLSELKYEKKLINSFKQLTQLNYDLLNQKYRDNFNTVYCKISQAFRTPAQEKELEQCYDKIVNKT